MHLHGGFGDAQLAGDLLVEPARSRPECRIARSRGVSTSNRALSTFRCFFVLAARTVASEPNVYRIQKILVAKRLREKFDGAALHRLHGHRNVAVSGDEDDRKTDARRGEIALKVESAPPRQSDVEDEAGRASGGSDARNSAIDANSRECRPTDRNSRPSDSRKSGSSSMTTTQASESGTALARD